MSREVDAVYNNGAFIPVTPIAIPEGAQVHLRVEERGVEPASKLMTQAEFQNLLQMMADLPLEESPKSSKMMTNEQKSEFLRMMIELPIESPNDGFSVADHDKLLYGQP
jgi:predicted DNA-binding antitoxin AbrB/MazE fold protein